MGRGAQRMLIFGEGATMHQSTSTTAVYLTVFVPVYFEGNLLLMQQAF